MSTNPAATKPAPEQSQPAGGKKPKDPRSKAQIKADEDAAESRKMLEAWLQYRGHLVLAFGRQPITAAHEQQFLEITSRLQKLQRTLLRILPRDVTFGNERMSSVVGSAISLQHLRELPEADQKKIYKEWHSIYILLTRAVGAMYFIAEGFEHHVKTREEMGIRGIKRGAGGSQADLPWHKNPSALTMAFVGAVILFFLLNYLKMLPFSF